MLSQRKMISLVCMFIFIKPKGMHLWVKVAELQKIRAGLVGQENPSCGEARIVAAV